MAKLPKITCPACRGEKPAQYKCKVCGKKGYLRVAPTSK